jgi:two-component system C4-dicarboxylate transport sensor histidine kinase DctB
VDDWRRILVLMDTDGRIVAANNRERLGENQRSQPSFIDALRDPTSTVFTVEREEGGFHSIRRTDDSGLGIAWCLLKWTLARLERSGGISDAVMVLDKEGRAILATETALAAVRKLDALALL